VGFLKGFYEILMGFLDGSYGNSMLYHVISMIFPWGFCGIPIGFP